MQRDNSVLPFKKRKRPRTDSEPHQVLGDNRIRESGEGDGKVTVGEKGDQNTVVLRMLKKVSKQGAVNCIKCLRKVKMETEKYFWDLNIKKMLLNLARAVNRALKAVSHGGHIGV